MIKLNEIKNLRKTLKKVLHIAIGCFFLYGLWHAIIENIQYILSHGFSLPPF